MIFVLFAFLVSSPLAGWAAGDHVALHVVSHKVGVDTGEPFIVDVDLSYRLSAPSNVWLVVRDTRATSDTLIKDLPPHLPRFDSRVKGYALLSGLEGSGSGTARIFVKGLLVPGLRLLEVAVHGDPKEVRRFEIDVSGRRMRALEGEIDPSLIESSVAGGAWSGARVLHPLSGDTVRLRLSDPANAKTIRWYRIIPDFTSFYRNAGWPGAEDQYQAREIDRIAYRRQEISRNQPEVTVFGRNGDADHGARRFLNYNTAAGTFWHQVEVTRTDGTVVRTPGIEEANRWGLRDDTFRISMRQGEGMLGYLSAYFNVPALFGSNPYQNRNYLGADCADAVWAAYRRSRGLPVDADHNVQHLTEMPDSFRRIQSFKLDRGQPDRRIRWGHDVQPGDVLAFKYRSGVRFQHIAAMYSDANDNGILDAADLILHTGPMPLTLEPLGRHSAYEALLLRPVGATAAAPQPADSPRTDPPAEETGSGGRWLFPSSDRTYLNEAEISRLSDDELWRARNEIYARRGLIFSTERGRRFAASLGSKYRGVTADSAAVYRSFNDVERANVELIRRFERSR